MRRIVRRNALVLALVCCGTIAWAQDTLKVDQSEMIVADYYNMSLEDLLKIKVTTGSFLSLDLQNSPMSLTIITADQMESSGARHLSDALEIYVPGFQYMINKWNGIIWGMRGVTNDRNTKFIFLVNGQKLNTESRDGAMTELDLGLLDDVERIEVLRGPAGLMYGSGAIAGVINIITKKYEEDKVTASVKAQTWSMNTFGQEGQIAVSRKLGENSSIRVDLGARRSDGVGAENSRLYGRPSWPYPQHLASPPQDGVPSAGSAWSTPGNSKAGIDLQLDKMRIYSRWTHQVTNAGGWFMLDPWTEVEGSPTNEESDRMVDGLMRSWDSFYANSESWGNNRRQYVLDNINSQATYSIPAGSNEVQLKGGFAGVTNRIQKEEIKHATNTAHLERKTKINETFGERRYNAGATYLLTSPSTFQMATGVEMSFYDIGVDLTGHNGQEETAKHLTVSNVQYLYGSVFAEGVYHITGKLDASLGVRYDLHTRTIDFGGVVNPKAALTYFFNDNNSLKLVYQQSANNASADNYEFNRYLIGDDGEPFVGDSYHFENPKNPNNIIPPVSAELLHELKPERSQSIELMSYHRVGKNFITMPSVSYNTISDMFAWNQTLFRVVNAGKYSSVVVDLDMQYSHSSFTVGANHSLQQLVGMEVSEQGFTEIAPVYTSSVYDSTIVGSEVYYTPRQLKTVDGRDSTRTIVYNYIRDGISVDGKNFLSLATHTTKIYADIKPVDWMTLHADSRIFWGLTGRTDIHEFDTLSNTNINLEFARNSLANAKDYPYLYAHKAPIVKFNLGVTLGSKNDKIKVSFLVYDLLGGNGSSASRHSLRWQQAYEAAVNDDLFAIDYRSYALKLTCNF